MYHGKRPAARLKAARHALILAAEANEFEEFAAGVADAERIQAVARCRPISGRAPIGGHGAKLPRLQEQAIAALLAQRSIAEAARTIDVGAQTLRRWLEERNHDVGNGGQPHASAHGVAFDYGNDRLWPAF